MSETRPAGRLLLIALGIVTAWCVLALFHTSEFLRFAAVVGARIPWEPVVCYQFVVALNWAVFTPPIVFVAERMPLRARDAAPTLLGLLVFAVTFAVLRAMVGGASLQLGQGDAPTWEFMLLSLELRFHRNFFFTTLIIAIVQMMIAQRQFAAADATAVALQGAVDAAELEKLRAALQPRFILHALEAIGTRIGRQPAGADVLLVDFGHLLRNMLSVTPPEESTLREELERIEPYLAFERERTDGAFSSRVVLPADLLDARVPSMLLHPLVQDALTRQFGRSGGHLEIRGTRNGDDLRLEVEEREASGLPDQAILVEVRARLEKMFATRTAIQTYQRVKGGAVTALRMPLHEPAGDFTDEPAYSDSRRRTDGAGAPANAPRS